MNRWPQWLPLPQRLIALFFLTALPALVAAQSMVREAPADVRPGQMRVIQAPVIEMDGKSDRLSPGARIRNPQNMQVLSGALTDQTHPVLFRRDSMGLVHEVWLLTPQEAARLGAGNASGPSLLDLIAQLLAARR